MAANVGSVATLTGNPQNMLIGSFSGISYRAFLGREAPVAVIGLACVIGVLWLVYRRQLPAALPPTNLAANFPIHAAIMRKTIIAVCVMLVAFFAGVPIALVAVGGAAVCLLTRRVKPEKVYREIDWQLLVLFTGLFVVIGGVEAARLTDSLFALAGRFALYRPAVLTVVTAALSNLVSNVPAVLLLQDDRPELRGAHARLARAGDGVHAGRKPHDPRLGRQPHRGRGSPRGARHDRVLGIRTGRHSRHVADADLWLGDPGPDAGVGIPNAIRRCPVGADIDSR